jgi:micrococcal nuclease
MTASVAPSAVREQPLGGALNAFMIAALVLAAPYNHHKVVLINSFLLRGFVLLRNILRALFGNRSARENKAGLKIVHEERFVRNRPNKQGYSRKQVEVSVVREVVEVEVCEQSESLVQTLSGICYVVDGDTIRIGNTSLRLAGIDAPELDHPWGQKAKWELVKLCKGNIITAKIEPEMSYDRLVATCFLPDGRDLSAEMVRRGYAIDWPKFSGGKYAHLEPEGVRKKHWKAAARQRGHMHIFNK